MCHQCGEKVREKDLVCMNCGALQLNNLKKLFKGAFKQYNKERE